ncbi:MAG: hypothetical protein GY948_06925 [Alphaproteobacteria bacterium]|nr:hypothetical protein [Alphaproteobacteria bacterium]
MRKALCLMPLLLTAVLVLGLSTVVRAEEDSPLEAIFAELAPSPAKDALDQIPDLGRRLLALRSYARSRSPLVKRWSWTETEIKAFHGSAEQEALLSEVGEIAAHFAAANPGFEIYARTKVRSLDLQIKNWNANRSVGAAGKEILEVWMEKFGSEEEAPANGAPKSFWRWLKGFRPSRRARLAAPGLSRHGQARAIDFQLKKDGRIFAGTSARSVKEVWRAEKWDEKLKASIEAAGPSFSGPLKNPDEPWHYDYDPKAQTAAKKKASN